MFLFRRTNGFYYIYYQNFNGKKTCISTKCKKKQDANLFLSNFQEEIRVRLSNKTIPISIEKFCFEFLKHSETMHTYKTTKTFKTSFKYLLKYFGNINLSEITHSDMLKYFENRINTSSVFAARKDLINISSSFNFAVSHKYLAENPCKNIKRFRLPEKQPIFFSELDFELLLAKVDLSDLRDLILFAVNTGLRQMELLTLEWEQVNFKDRMIILSNHKHLTKSKKIRAIPLNLTALQVLSKRELTKSGNLVFTYLNKPISQHFISAKFKQYIRKANLNDKLNFHSLRSTFASWLVQKGANIYEVSKLLGHSDLKVTQVYAHLQPNNLRLSVELLNN